MWGSNIPVPACQSRMHVSNGCRKPQPPAREQVEPKASPWRPKRDRVTVSDLSAGSTGRFGTRVDRYIESVFVPGSILGLGPFGNAGCGRSRCKVSQQERPGVCPRRPSSSPKNSNVSAQPGHRVRSTMPTIEQLVREGRKPKKKKTNVVEAKQLSSSGSHLYINMQGQPYSAKTIPKPICS